MALTGVRFTLEVAGQNDDTFAVVGFQLHQRYSTPFELTVDVASQSFTLTADQLLEKNATLTIWQGQTELRTVSGNIATFSMKESNGWQMQYRFRICPPLWRCGLRQNFRSFQQQDIQAISAMLLSENGITDWTPILYDAHPAREFCVQYGESDLDFLSRLWAEEGLFFFDKHGEQQRLVLTDDVAGLPQAGAFPFNPNSTSTASPEFISAFLYEANVGPSSVVTQDYTFKVPDWPGSYDHSAENLNGQYQQYEIYDYPGRFKDEQHGEGFARYQMEGRRNSAEMASGASNSPRLWPGTRFTLTGHPVESLNQEWQVASIHLTGSQPQALHGSQDKGTTLVNHFTAIPADRTWRSEPPAKPKVDGPQSAVVTGPPGEEIFCDEHGRIRVKFLWDRYNGATEDSSCWIRVSQAWAGTGFGNLAIPRVGQEVIVDFLNGDPDQPIVMGRTYHEDNRSPGDLPGTKTQMSIRSKTYKGSGFNELRFEDATGKEQVYIHAQKNMDTEVLNNRTTDVKVDHSETIGNDQKIIVGLGQTTKVGKENAAGHDQNVTVAHDQSTHIGNDQQLNVKNDRKVSISHDDGLYVAKDRKITVEGKQEHKTSGDHISLVEGKQSLVVKGDLAQKINGALGLKAQGEIVLESGMKITLKVGGSFIAISATGVDIMGPIINLNSGGSPGTPVTTLTPSFLTISGDDGTSGSDDESSDDGGEGNGDDSGGGDDSEDQDDSDSYVFQLRYTDDTGIPYSGTRYRATFEDGTKKDGEIDEEGYTEMYSLETKQKVKIRLLDQAIDMIEGGVYE